ncbi:MAG: DNA repair protein RecO [Kiritimatiellaeota bacterium]|nr:DNA repair protein RecO [Kiritimatiellota bacterium]
MFTKTTATVLRVSPFSRTSHVVTWLASDGRHITTVVKGATRPKSVFLGQYDLFYTCELVFYERERDNALRIAKECFPEKPRSNLRLNWRAAQCAGWFATLAREVSENSPPDPALHKLLDETLDAISASPTSPPSPLVFARYEAKLLALCGLRPNFAPCPHCGKSDMSFNLAAGSRHCHEHSERRPYDPIIDIKPELAALFDKCANSQLPTLNFQPSTPNPQLVPLLRFLGLFLRLHLDGVNTAGRAIALDSLKI